MITVLVAAALAAGVAPVHAGSAASPAAAWPAESRTASLLRAASGSPPSGAYFDYVVVLIMENHNLCDVYYGNSTKSPCGTTPTGAPYETGLSNNYSIPLADHYCNVNPSLPNYLCLSGASTFGCTADDLPNSTTCTKLAWKAENIVDRIVSAGLTWKAYMENMTKDCQGSNVGTYAAKHDPFVYYDDIVSNASRCNRVVPAGTNDAALLNDLNSTSTASNYMWLTPNLKNDAHDTSVAYGDGYLSHLVPKILGSPLFQTRRAALFITYDEGYSHPTYATWAGPVVKRYYASTALYSHFSVLSTVESNWKLSPLNANDTGAANMSEFFLPPPPPPPPPLVAGFTFSPSAPIAGQSIHFATNVSGGSPPYTEAWEFGDGATGAGSAVNHTYAAAGSYVVNLTVTDAASQTANDSKTVVVGSPPPPPLTAGFSFSPTSPLTNATVAFTATASGGTPPYSFGWGFGDGSVGASANTTHAYAAPGTFTVNLTVKDAAARNTIASKTIVVRPPPPPLLVAHLASSPASPVANETVTFNGTASGGTSPYTFNWSFGDGSSGAGVTVGHAYAISGSYTVNLTVRDSGVQTAYAQTTINVSIPPPPPGAPVARFTTAPPWPQVNASITLNASGSSDPNAGATLQFRWDWTDDGVWDTAWSSSPLASHAYAASGTYTARLEVLDSYGMTANATQPVVVDGVPPVTTASLAGALGNGGWYLGAVTVTLSANDSLSGVASTSYAVDNGSWQPYATPFLVTADGAHAVSYRSTDRAGNVERVETTTFRIDATPPVTSASFAGTVNGSVFVTPIQVTLTATDAGSGIAATRYRIDAALWANYTVPFFVDNNGSHQVSYGSVDVAGNTETTHTLDVVNGTIAGVPGPVSTANLQGTLGTGGWYTSSVTVTLLLVNGTSPPDTIGYRVDGGPWAVYAGAFSVTGDGVHELEYNASTNLGIVEATHRVAISIDTVPPVATAAAAGVAGTNGWYLSNVTVTLSASDATSGVANLTYRIDGGPWQTYASPIVIPEGVHTVDYFATDHAGNAAAPQTVAISVDLTPPSTAATLTGVPGNAGWYLSNVTVALNATDVGSGVAALVYRVDGGAWLPYSGTFLVGEGRHTLEFYATDRAGNVETIQSRDLFVDTTPPASSAAPSGSLGANGWYTSNVSVTLSATDAGSGVASITYRIDGGAWQSYTGAILVTEGVHVVEFYATDVAGNVEPVQTLDLSVDTTPPASQATASGTAGANGWYVSNVTVTLTATDATSGVASITYSVDGGAWTVYSGALLLAEGQHIVRYYATDHAGNREATHALDISVDTTPPVANATAAGTPGLNGWYVSNVTVTINATDATSGVAAITYRVDLGPWANASGPVVLVLSDGRHVVDFEATDRAGLMSPLHSLVVRVDTSPPVAHLSATGTAGNGTWYVSNVTVSLSASPGASGLENLSYALDGGAWQRYTGPLTLTEGVHVIEYAASDVNGLTESPQSATLAIDTTAPVTVCALAGRQGSAGWFVSNVTATLSSTDATSGVRAVTYRVDGGAWRSYTGSFPIGEGRHTIAFYATDNAGLNESVESANVSVDVTPPVTAYQLAGTAGNGTWYLSNVTVTLHPTDALSQVAVTRVSVDGGAWSVYNGPFTITGGGRHQVAFASVDVAGNREAVSTIEVDIEDSGPSFASLTAPANATGPAVSVSWSAIEDDSPILEYLVSVDGGPFQSVGTATEFQLTLSAGMHTVRVRAVDAAGESATGSVSVRVQPTSSGGGGPNPPPTPTPPVTPSSPALPWFASGAFLVILVLGSLGVTLGSVLAWSRAARARRLR